jgi:hypothetical protein
MRTWNWTQRAKRIGYAITIVAFFAGLELLERALDVIL